jgi:CheY-like chemotaxis protein
MNAILLAEDETVSRRFLEDAISALGYRCESVVDGAQALHAAQTRPFGLLLLDLNLPVLRGTEVLRQLRAHDRALSRNAPAIALTADHEIDTEHHLIDAGFLAVGRKPLDVLALERLITLVVAPPAPLRAVVRPPPDWDDDDALDAAGGQRETVIALRALMRRDLPGQRSAILTGIHARQHDVVRAELHRLRAACGFCGAVELAAAVEELHAALDEPEIPQHTMTRFLAAVDRAIDAR